MGNPRKEDVDKQNLKIIMWCSPNELALIDAFCFKHKLKRGTLMRECILAKIRSTLNEPISD